MNLLQQSEELDTATLRCRVVYEKYGLNGIFIEISDSCIRWSMREYRGAKKKTTLQYLAFHARLLLRLHGRDISSKSTQRISAGQDTTKNKAPHRTSTWSSSRSGVHIDDSRTTSGPSTLLRISSRTLVTAKDSSTTPIDAVFSMAASMDSLSTIDNALFCHVCRQENHSTLECTFVSHDQRKLFINQRGTNC